MNLTTGKWIPVIWTNGIFDKVSLLDIFQHGDQISDLAVRPHERIALMRLLICITQAALDGPADYDDWKECHPRITPAATAYLAKWKDAFECLGTGSGFCRSKAFKQIKLPEMMTIRRVNWIWLLPPATVPRFLIMPELAQEVLERTI